MLTKVLMPCSVAQIGNLPYRRMAFGRAAGVIEESADFQSAIRPTASRRYVTERGLPGRSGYGGKPGPNRVNGRAPKTLVLFVSFADGTNTSLAGADARPAGLATNQSKKSFALTPRFCGDSER